MARDVLIVYDIPTKSKVNPAPSAVFRRCGVRINLSCWVVREDKIPHDYLENQLTASGATWDIVRFDERERERILALAKRALIHEAQRIADSMQLSIVRAEDRLKTLCSTESDTFVRNQLARARRLVGNAKESALAFEILDDVQEAFNATQTAIAAETDAWLVRRKQLRDEQAARAQSLLNQGDAA